MNTVLITVIGGVGSAAVQDIRRFRTREDRSKKFDWGYFGLNVLEGAITGLLIGLGINQVPA